MRVVSSGVLYVPGKVRKVPVLSVHFSLLSSYFIQYKAYWSAFFFAIFPFFYAKTLQSCKHGGVHFQLCNGVSLMPSSVTSRCLNAVSYITDKHQIRNLLNNVQRVGQTSRPEHFPQNIDLILQFTGNHCMNGVLGGAGIPSLG